MIMSVGSGGQGGGAWPPWIFIHGSNIVDRGLIVLFFSLFFVAPNPLEIFLPTPLVMINILNE